MRKTLLVLMILLLAWWVYSPVCLAENKTQSDSSDNKQTTEGSPTVTLKPTEGVEPTKGDKPTEDDEPTEDIEPTKDVESVNGADTAGKHQASEGTDDNSAQEIIIKISKKDLIGKKSKVILIEDNGSGWRYKQEQDLDKTPINLGWILLVVASVISLAVNCFIIFSRRRR